MPRKKKKLDLKENISKYLDEIWTKFKELSAEDSVKFVTFIATVYLIYNTIAGTKEILDEIKEQYGKPFVWKPPL